MISWHWCDKVRYRNNGFLEQVCVCRTDADRTGGTARPLRGNSVSYVIVTHFDRLDCAANAKINVKCNILCTFASSGGIRALT